MASRFNSEIDLGRLEEHWVEQTPMFANYAKKQAAAKADLSDAQSQKEVAEAEAKRRIRRNPAKYGMTKVTEPAVKEAMVLHPLYRKAVNALNEAQHAVDVLTGVLRTLEHRKATLENLVTLHGQNYFSKPRVPKGLDRDVADSLSLAEKKRRRKGLRRRKK